MAQDLRWQTETDAAHARHMCAPAALQRWIYGIEGDPRIDQLAKGVTRLGRRVGRGRRGDLLRGQWLGHALHPLLTDFPLGCWLASGLLDLSGRPAFRAASQRLVGIGLVATFPTAMSGLTDYGEVSDPRVSRLGALHALGNGAVTTAYLLSWRDRRNGRHWRGVAFGMLGGLGAWVTGYLGGHLSLARNVGSGERGLGAPAPPGT
jgi:uncharacterized membrane protein